MLAGSISRRARRCSDTPAGTSRVYRVDPDALASLRSYFDAFWSRSLESFRRTAEATSADLAARHPGPERPDQHTLPARSQEEE